MQAEREMRAKNKAAKAGGKNKSSSSTSGKQAGGRGGNKPLKGTTRDPDSSDDEGDELPGGFVDRLGAISI